MRPGQLTPENEFIDVALDALEIASMRPGQLTPENCSRIEANSDSIRRLQ